MPDYSFICFTSCLSSCLLAVPRTDLLLEAPKPIFLDIEIAEDLSLDLEAPTREKFMELFLESKTSESKGIY
jgi:hypothetical protein